MVYAIVHRFSGAVLETHAVSSAEECREAYRLNHPELECDTYSEMTQKWPGLIANLMIYPVH